MYFPINLLISLAHLIPSPCLLYVELGERDTEGLEVFDPYFILEEEMSMECKRESDNTSS